MASKTERSIFRKARVRRKIFGTPNQPRLSVYGSLKHIYAQIINDVEGRTLVAASSVEKTFGELNGMKAAVKVGELVGKRAVEKGIKNVVFDRGVRRYQGRLKALADSARQAGLKF